MLQRKLMRVTVSFVDEIFLKNRTQMTTSAQLYHVSTTLSRQHKMAQKNDEFRSCTSYS